MTLISSRLSLCWLLLVLASLLSFESAAQGSRLAGAIVIVVALVKAAVVGGEFMELRQAHAVLKTLFFAWVALLGATLLSIFYLYGQ